MEKTDLIRPGEAAQLFGVTVSTLARWSRAKKLRCVMLPGGQRRYYAADVRELLRSMKEN